MICQLLILSECGVQNFVGTLEKYRAMQICHYVFVTQDLSEMLVILARINPLRHFVRNVSPQANIGCLLCQLF